MNLMNQINYLKEYLDQDMFDDCSVPDGLEMQRVRGAIVMRCGLLTPLFSEPETQRAATQQFFFENQWNFEHIIKVLQAEYSPIENVAEWRNESTENKGTENLTITRKGSEAHSGTDARTINDSGNNSTERQISAENATTYQADNKEIDTFGKQTTDNLTHGEAINTTGNDQHTSDKNGTTDYEVYRHGNVGVTTNNQLIMEELSMLQQFNPYRFIADLYEKELILGIY